MQQTRIVLVEGRFRTSIREEDCFLLPYPRYIELNPVRAGMVKDPGDFRWSATAPIHLA